MSRPIPSEHLRVANETLSCRPDVDAILSHQLQSTASEYGFQALLVFKKCEKDFLETIGPSSEDFPSGLGAAYLQSCKPYTKFVKHSKADVGCKTILTIENYLNLYSFFVLKWPLVLNQLTATSSSMSSGKEWIRIGKNLKFFHNGQCTYSCTLGGDLKLTATAGSKKNGTGDYEIGLFLCRAGGDDSQFELPVSTVTKLFSDTEAYHFILEHYKRMQSAQLPVDQR